MAEGDSARTDKAFAPAESDKLAATCKAFTQDEAMLPLPRPLPLSLPLPLHCVFHWCPNIGQQQQGAVGAKTKAMWKRHRRWVYQCNGNDVGCHFPCLSTHTLRLLYVRVCVCVSCLLGCVCKHCKLLRWKPTSSQPQNCGRHWTKTICTTWTENAYTPRYHQWENLWPALSAFTNIWCICHGLRVVVVAVVGIVMQ